MEERLNKTLDWLFSLEARGEIYKLERMENALALIGNPHRKLRSVHIAGTKGKGSVAAMLDSVLRAAGMRCGLYTKPHLVNLAERTRIDGAEMPPARMLDYIESLRAIYDRAGLALTFFEFTVAIMFLYFADEHVDLAIIETGLGGRLDSTNVVTPILSVITPIGYDHMEYLGYTIGAIAAEKGGIIKPEVPVVIGARDHEARATLTSMAAQRRSATRLVDRDFSFRSHAPAHRLDYHGLALSLDNLELGLAGPFQHENAAIALAAVEELRAQGSTIPEDAIRRGLREVYWPGRFDIVSRDPMVILDCAHNELAVSALLETISVELNPDVRPHLVFGCLASKQWERMAAMLAPRVADVTLTRAKPKNPLDPAELFPAFAAHAPARIERDPIAAIDQVVRAAAPGEVVLATGSVYLIGEIYPYFLARDGRRGLFPEARA
ncbi:MAG TPA: folylpolyglutamate synthase/dihydrofolate synthase family protein [Candidatus Binataceae bacterium]|nr:folylpolyglutamate synthase/dihydrofolate synthase family protein [Candidatus Binataceae bacterium]